MKPGGRITAYVVGLILTGAAAPVEGLEVLVAAPGEILEGDTLAVSASPSDTLIASFRVTDIFDAGASIGDGIPATLLLVVDLWRDRSGWWDSLVRSQAFTYTFRRDVWNGQVDFWGLDNRKIVLPDRDHLVANLERVHEIVLGVPRHFLPGKKYYITVKAVIQPMSLDDLQRLDAWLSGKVTKSRGDGGLLGIPKALARIVVDVSGLGDQTALGESSPFIPRP